MNRIYPDPHSSRQLETAIEYGLATDGATMVNAALGPGITSREEALEIAGRVRCPTLIVQNEGDRILDVETSGPLAEATGGRLVTVPGGPAPWARYPVAVNLALRRFFDDAITAQGQ
jgi:pimeloyl-ACP methyl ester carboxylesterase